MKVFSATSLTLLVGLLPLSGNAISLRRSLAKPDGDNPNKPPKDPPTTDPPLTDPPSNESPYPTCEQSDGSVLRLWTVSEVEGNNTNCNIVFYNRVYVMDEFIPIHKGGADAIERNCRKDGTWLFENLQCISMVPDHFEGMLNMCTGYQVGVLTGTNEDPCATTNDGFADPEWTKPTYEDPDFTTCDVYHNITCTALREQQDVLLPLPADTVAALYSVGGDWAVVEKRWTEEDVSAAQAVWTTPTIDNNYTEHCYVLLHGWVYDLAVSPLDGSAPFYLKHGNGMFPWEILRHCGTDMTPPFDAIDNMGTLCAPDHTLGALNVLTGYLVGVEMGSENDACASFNLADEYPPTACLTHQENNLLNYTLQDFENLPTSDQECYMILQGGVYNLAEFSHYHAGGDSKITTQCGKDATKTFMSKSFHKHRIFLATLQDFKTGIIIDSIGDPCSTNYDEQLEWW